MEEEVETEGDSDAVEEVVVVDEAEVGDEELANQRTRNGHRSQNSVD